MKPSIQFVKREDGVRIAYSEFGKGPPLVCPSPWITSLSYIFEDPFAKQFWERLAQEVTVITYDKHGCGQSDRNRKDFTLKAELLDLETVIDHLGLKEFNLLGSSMEGPISIAYLARHPKRVTRLILYGAYARGKDLAIEKIRSAIISLIKASWGLGSKALADMFYPEAGTEELQSLAKFHRDTAAPEVIANLFELAYSLDVSKLLPNISVPTLILHRDGDKVVHIDHGRQLAREIPHAQFKVLRGKVHLWVYGETDDIINEIAQFIGTGKSGMPSLDTHADISKEGTEKDIGELTTDEAEIVEQATIVFSDIASSTDLVTELGDCAAREIFLKHDQLVRKQVKKHGGRELQNLGDGFMLSFNSATEAIKCACDIQKEISEKIASIKVRIGVNTGEVVRREGAHPFGQAVVVASRILSRAKGAQIMVSDVTKQLASGGGFSFLEKGRFKPKGFKETMKLYEVKWKG
jgi:class 3 adenylate cyclase/pimeloyl-ACP methyl ester carboxylesterase